MRRWAWVVLGGCALVCVRAASAPVEVRATPVALDPRDATVTHVGHLTYRGGLRLDSPAAEFGGLSALHVSPEGDVLVAVSDQGSWLRAELVYDAAGALTGVARAEMGPLRDEHGAPLVGKGQQDAEGLARLPDGSWVVSFERHHRLWRYAPGPAPVGAAEPLATPRELRAAPPNGGLEALAAFDDGRLVALTEEQRVRGGLRGFLHEGHRWRAFTYAPADFESPSAAAVLPSGDLLVVERGYTPERGPSVRLSRVPGRRVRGGARVTGELVARFAPPLMLDNFEGLAVRRAPAGETLLYLVSDNNFSAEQRTLLLLFALDETGLSR